MLSAWHSALPGLKQQSARRFIAEHKTSKVLHKCALMYFTKLGEQCRFTVKMYLCFTEGPLSMLFAKSMISPYNLQNLVSWICTLN